MMRIKVTRLGRFTAALGGLTLVAGFLATPSAFAQSSGGSASTGATVGGFTTAPVIECAWALNDANHDWQDRMQYGSDDSSSGAGSPCVAVGNEARMVSNPYLTPVIDVRPNAHDDPTEQFVELWGAIKSNNEKPSVYFEVYHPDGTHKVQIDASKYASSKPPSSQSRCVGPPNMYRWAEATGQLTAGATANLIAECKFQQKSIWYGAFGISKHQPNGLYKIELHAAAAGGLQSIQTFYINVVGFMNLEKDFTSIDFGSVGPNSHFNQNGAGDFNFDGADQDGNQATSVRNTGNSGVALGVKFASMCLELRKSSEEPLNPPSCTDAKRIDHFDMKFGVGVLENLEYRGSDNIETSLVSNLDSDLKPAPLGRQHNFSTDIERTLCPNDVGKIEFSIWTENIQAGRYDSGASVGIQLVARPNPICITDPKGGQHVYLQNRGTPSFGNPETPKSSVHWDLISE